MLGEATALAAQLEQAQRAAAAAQAAIQSLTTADDQRTSQLEKEVGAAQAHPDRRRWPAWMRNSVHNTRHFLSRLLLPDSLK